MRRLLLVLLLIAALAPGTWIYQTRPPLRPTTASGIRFTKLVLPSQAVLSAHLGVFTLESAWQITGPPRIFGGWSALLPMPGGRLMAISDGAKYLTFPEPGTPPRPAQFGEVLPGRRHYRHDNDTESATRDPATGTIWVGREDTNAISRHTPDFRSFVSIRPPAMRDWPHNTGPEAMVRLADGRFIVLAEGFTGLFESHRHHAVLFPRDPLLGDKPALFTFAGAGEFSVTDMAQMPDGRVLILMRRLLWPLPLRFAGRIMIADPARIRPGGLWQGTEVVKLSSSLPVDNFEGMAIEPGENGRVTVWLISDDNFAATQRTLLWKLTVDPARLPR